MILEILEIENSNDVIKFSIGDIHKIDENFFQTEVIFYHNSEILSKIKLSSLSEFDVIRNSVIYIGNKVRGIMKDKGIKIDLIGLNVDEYIPLPKAHRILWEED
jgi:hypothetical protein